MGEPGGTSGLLEVATMAHLVLGILRTVLGARSGRSRLASIPSFLCAPTPWFFPSAGAVFAVLAADVLWFFAAGRLLGGRAETHGAAGPPTTTLRVLGVRPETDEIRTFRLERPPGFDFEPGYLTVVVPVEGRLVSRCYSICSAPAERRHLEISVRKQGVVRRHSTRASVPGARSRRANPPASLPTPRTAAGRWSFSEAASGSRRSSRCSATPPPRTPVRGHAAPLRPDGGADPFKAELEELGRRPGLRVVVTATRGGAVPPVRSGRLDLDFVRREIRDPAACVFCMCGPGEMIDGFKTGLPGLGVPPEQVRAEAFEAAKHGPGAHAAGGPFTLEMTASGKTVSVRPGATLLEAAEAAGVDIPSSCRGRHLPDLPDEGRLGRSCLPGGLHGRRGPTERVGYTPCVAWPKSNCVLDA